MSVSKLVHILLLHMVGGHTHKQTPIFWLRTMSTDVSSPKVGIGNNTSLPIYLPLIHSPLFLPPPDQPSYMIVIITEKEKKGKKQLLPNISPPFRHSPSTYILHTVSLSCRLAVSYSTYFPIFPFDIGFGYRRPERKEKN
ncbi:hypothetical protein B0J18DRAFT_182284 [Chaetomium sp. MPI-SDFR-AT-0129]|nr:hypothetical protein B0J18DRAFT_182284 [Chaetomium sp. MPI-SDFR-AT-0129]